MIKILKKASAYDHLRALIGKDYKSNNSVGGQNFSGKIRLLKEIGSWASQLSQRSEITLI